MELSPALFTTSSATRQRDIRALLDSVASPSEAYWRAFELDAVREHNLERPILEVGCGDGRIAGLLGLRVDHGIDLNPRAVERARRAGVFDRVTAIDVKRLQESPGSYATIFANSVLEHIPGVDGV